MAKHKKRNWKARNKKRQVKLTALEVVHPNREGLTLFTKDERSRLSPYIVGQTFCLRCRQMTRVHNDDGLQGNPMWDMFVHHYLPGQNILCAGSNEYLHRQKDIDN